MDEQNKVNIYRVWEQNFQVYGARKIWWQMNRQGQCIARCTVERLMRDLEIEGVRRGKRLRTTMPDQSRPCPQDLVLRQFAACRPDQLWVGNKHFKIDRRVPITSNTSSSTGFGMGRYGKGGYGIGEESIAIELNDESSFQCDEFVRNVVSVWKCFFTTYNIPTL
jgi:transposase InsO family protein